MKEKIASLCRSKKYCSIENAVFIGVLLLFPLLLIRYGIDYTDTGYSICNFQSFGKTEGTIQMATFLANALGALFMQLPYGDTYLGIVAYTSIFVGALAVVSYLLLRKFLSQKLVFLGVFVALCVRWCPSVVLYNYISYFLYTLAIVFSLQGLKKNRTFCLFLAGVLLGANVFVRFPNVTHCLLILTVIFYCVIEKKRTDEIMKKIMVCIGGWISSVLLIWCLISLFYGVNAYTDMISKLFSGTEGDSSYDLLSMLTGNFVEFWAYRKWILLLTGLILAGVIVYKFCKYKWMKILFVCGYTAGFAFMMKYFHYWAVFTIKDYGSYSAISFWLVLFIITAWILGFKGCLTKRYSSELRFMSAVCICTVFLAPIGSNTGILASFNNMYLVLPFVFGILKEELCANDTELKIKKLSISKKPIALISLFAVAIMVIQGLMFSVFYIYGDYKLNADMVTKIENNEVMRGACVSAGNAYLIEDVSRYVAENGLAGKQCIAYGNIPIMSFALDMPQALSTSWPDLETYTYEDMAYDLQGIERPIIILNKYYAFSIFDENVQKDIPKTKLLADYINDNGYVVSYENEKFAIYKAK